MEWVSLTGLPNKTRRVFGAFTRVSESWLHTSTSVSHYLANTFPLPPGNEYGCCRRKTCPTRLHGI